MHAALALGRRYSFLLLLLLANLTLILPAANPIRILGAMLLIGLLPGWLWSIRFAPASPGLERGVIAAGLSFLITCLLTLPLHYLPGPIPMWQVVVTLNTAAVLPFLWPSESQKSSTTSSPRLAGAIPLLLILLAAFFLRAANLHYSEFQGDEALAMIAAAEALEGHENALFLRSKGPGEILLPAALWRLTGTISEPIARLPFTTAALFAVATIYLIGQAIGGQRAGWLAAGFFAFNGFMIAFGRIVQYQALVVWLSALAFLMAVRWQTHRQNRLALLSGLFLGVGLLAHYDAILVLPAVGWLFASAVLADHFPKTFSYVAPLTTAKSNISTFVKAGATFLATFSLPVLLFYLPFALDPQANRTGEYVGGRVGSELRNNLPDFFHFNTFYSSFYGIAFTGILVLIFLLSLLWQPRRQRIVAVALTSAAVAVVFSPSLLATPVVDLTVLPFSLLLLASFLASAFISATLSALLVWLAVPFLGYNFVVALGLTHIYTIVPAWSLLAALGWIAFTNYLLISPSPNLPNIRWADGIVIGFFALSILFLWNAFVRHDIEYWQDYPAGNLALFWTPYSAPPEAGFFGFAHRAGWKAVGQQIDDGLLAGDYGSNEEPDVTTWYTRGAPRACDPRPEFYFLADDLVDPVDTPGELIAEEYEQIGQVTLPNQKQMQVMQQQPSTLQLNQIDEALLARAFDQTAVPAAFARSARGSLPSEAEFGSASLGPLARLVGYDLDTRRAYPGGRVPVTLYWQVLAEFPAGYQIFTHLEGDSGPVAQSDGVPVCWSYPTDTWRPGQIIADQHALSLAPDLQPGSYPLTVGFYLADTFERLDLLDEAGNPAGTKLTLDTIKIDDEKPEMRDINLD